MANTCRRTCCRPSGHTADRGSSQHAQTITAASPSRPIPRRAAGRAAGRFVYVPPRPAQRVRAGRYKCCASHTATDPPCFDGRCLTALRQLHHQRRRCGSFLPFQPPNPDAVLLRGRHENKPQHVHGSCEQVRVRRQCGLVVAAGRLRAGWRGSVRCGSAGAACEIVRCKGPLPRSARCKYGRCTCAVPPPTHRSVRRG